MAIIVRRNKEKFSRKRFRENEVGSFFNKTSTGLSTVLSLIIALFFTPALITTSILSTEILLPLANIFLSIGYLTNFIYRLAKGEISTAELIVTMLILTTFFSIAFFVFPPVSVVSTLSVIQAVNQSAVVINLFFLIRNSLVPPLKYLVEQISQSLGFDISGQYYTKPELTLDNDRFVVDKILEKDYGYDSHSPNYNASELIQLNNLLKMMTFYMNKYSEHFFGYIRHQDEIELLESKISDFTILGETDSSYSFIRTKIRFKTTKVQLLQDALDQVEQALENTSDLNPNVINFFHTPLFEKRPNTEDLLTAGLLNLQEEISRQQTKIEILKNCLPP